MTLVVDGKEFAAKLLKADEARRIYESIVRKKKDPALLEYAGFGLYRTRAFPLQPGKPCKVIVTYKNTCKKDRELVEVWYPLNTEKFSAKPIESVRVRVDIKSKADITAVYSPSHDLKTERKGSRHVIATYEATSALPTTDFQVYYKAADEAVGATLLTWQGDAKKDGYFLMLVSPNPRASAKAVVPKNVVVVLDHSGSMSGPKLTQGKEALRYVLRNLNREDRFNVVLYNDQVDALFERLQPVRDAEIDEAMERIDRIDATGGTNIHEALQAAMKLCADSKRPSYVLFLTDGQPTVGKTKEADILSDTKVANQSKVRLFAFGVGYAPNVRLLDKLVAANNGRSDYVKPKEPIEAKVSSLYSKIKNPVMTELKVTLKGLKLRDMYPREVGDLFDGDQILLVGRYDAGDAKKLPKEEGKGRSTLLVKGRYEGKERAFEYPVTVNGVGRKAYQFVEKLWAIRRVGYLLDQIQLHGKSKEILDELVRLSRDYGIMTPYTSFLADETTRLAHAPTLSVRGSEALTPLAKTSGEEAHRAAKSRKMLREAEKLPGGYLYRAKPRSGPDDGRHVIGHAGKGAGRGGTGGGRLATGQSGGGAPAGAMLLGDIKDDAEGLKKVLAMANVRQIGNNYVLYRRGRIWLMPDTAKLDPVKDADKITKIKRFSKEYFDLARANTRAQNGILASQKDGETLRVKFRGKVYSISD
jgi:Ca-activated chloride channel family protein